MKTDDKSLQAKIDNRSDFHQYAQSLFNFAKHAEETGSNDTNDKFFEENLQLLKQATQALPKKYEQSKDTVKRTFQKPNIEIHNPDYKKRGRKPNVISFSNVTDPWEEIIQMVYDDNNIANVAWIKILHLEKNFVKTRISKWAVEDQQLFFSLYDKAGNQWRCSNCGVFERKKLPDDWQYIPCNGELKI